MTEIAWRDSDDRTRWFVCLLVVLAAHGVAGVYVLSQTAPPPPEVLPSAVMIDLAPVAAPPPAEAPIQEPEPPSEQPPPPAPLEVPPPEPPPELVLEPPKVLEPPPPTVTPEVTLPPPPRPQRKPPRPQPVMPQPVSQDPAPPVSTSPAPAAQEQAVRAVSSAVAAATWQSRLLAHLTRFKRYPPSAQMRHEQGVAHLRFTMTAAGTVLSYRLERSSGHAALDQETLDLIRRAQPLPPLPQEMAQQTVELVVPLRFELR